MVILALVAAAAVADPGALRAPGAGETAQVVVVWPDVAVGGWVSERFGVYAAAEEKLGIGEAGVGTVQPIVGADSTWGMDLIATAGVLAPLVRPRVGLALTPALQAGARGEKAHATLAAVVPVAWDLGEPGAPRLGVEGELRVGVRAGPVWLSLSGAMGPAWVPGGLTRMDGRVGGSVGFVPGALGE